MWGRKGMRSRPLNSSQGPLDQGAAAAKGGVIDKATSLKALKAKATVKAGKLWLRNKVSGAVTCFQGSHDGPELKHIGIDSGALDTGCTTAPAAGHQQQQEGVEASRAPSPVHRPRSPGCSGVTVDRDPHQDRRVGEVADLGSEVAQQVTQPAPEGGMDASGRTASPAPGPTSGATNLEGAAIKMEAAHPVGLALPSPPQEVMPSPTKAACPMVEALPLTRCPSPSTSHPSTGSSAAAAMSSSTTIIPDGSAKGEAATSSGHGEEEEVEGLCGDVIALVDISPPEAAKPVTTSTLAPCLVDVVDRTSSSSSGTTRTSTPAMPAPQVAAAAAALEEADAVLAQGSLVDSPPVQVDADSDAFEASTLALCQRFQAYRQDQQQLLLDTESSAQQLSQTCLAAVGTAGVFLQQVFRLQQALRQEGMAKTAAEADAQLKGAVVAALQLEVDALAVQLAQARQQLQQQQQSLVASVAKEVGQAEGERDAAQLQVQQLAAVLKATQGQLAQCRAQLLQAQQQMQEMLPLQQSYTELCAECQQQEEQLAVVTLQRDSQQLQLATAQQRLEASAVQLQNGAQERASLAQQLLVARGERDSCSQQLAEAQQQVAALQRQLQQVPPKQGPPPGFEQQHQLQKPASSKRGPPPGFEQQHQLQKPASSKRGPPPGFEQQQQQQQVWGQPDSVSQELAAAQQQVNVLVCRLGIARQEQARLVAQLQQLQEEWQQEQAELKEGMRGLTAQLDLESAKGAMLQLAINQLLGMQGPGQVRGVGMPGDAVGSGAQGAVCNVRLYVEPRPGMTPEEAAEAGLAPTAPGSPVWEEVVVVKEGAPAGAAHEVALTALATVEGARLGMVLGPRLRYVELGAQGQKPRLYFEKWHCDLWQLLTSEPLTLKQRLLLVEGMARGMHRLHAILGLAHFDVKPLNFLVRQLADGNWEVCPADFGHSRDRATLAQQQQERGVPHVILSAGYTSPALAAWCPFVQWLLEEKGQLEVLEPRLRQLLAQEPHLLSLEDAQRADVPPTCISMVEVLLVSPSDTRQLAERWDMVVLDPLLDQHYMRTKELTERSTAAGSFLNLWGKQVTTANLVRSLKGQVVGAAGEEGVAERLDSLCTLLVTGMRELGVGVDLAEVAEAAAALREAL